ncbi:hypothetical protein [Actinacidiphila alni]|uniref:hypothetical protein n=1 Tax=Actinacidiphila alni TaxID=380248 RepID=UPI00345394DD
MTVEELRRAMDARVREHGEDDVRGAQVGDGRRLLFDQLAEFTDGARFGGAVRHLPCQEKQSAAMDAQILEPCRAAQHRGGDLGVLARPPGRQQA